MLYVQLVDTQNSKTESAFPVPQLVTACSVTGPGSGDALRIGPGSDTGDEGDTGPPSEAESTASAYVDQAMQAYDDAQEAYKDGDLGTYQDKVDEMGDLLQKAQDVMEGKQPPIDSGGDTSGDQGGDSGG